MPGLRRINHTKIDARTRRGLAILAQEASLIFGDGLSVDGTVGGIGGGTTITINLATPSGLTTSGGLAINPKASGSIAIDTDGVYVDLDSTPGLQSLSGGLSILLDSNPGLATTTGLTIILDTPAHGQHMSLAAGGISVDDDYVFNTGDTMSGDYTVTGDLTVQTDFSVTGTFVPRSTHLSWDGLVGYWPGNGTGHDYSSSGLKGTWTGNTGYTTGRFGQCFDFDAVSYITTQNINQDPTAVTVAGWVNLDSTHSDIIACIAAKNFHPSNNPVDCWFLYQDETGGANDGKWCFQIGWGSGANDFTVVPSSGAATKDAWVFLTATYDGFNLRLYINGVLDNTVAKTTSIVLSALPHYIGIRLPGATYSEFKGQIDELMVFDRVLGADEIKSVYERREAFETFGFPTSLIVGDDLTVTNDLSVTADTTLSGTTILVNAATFGGDLIFDGDSAGLIYGEISKVSNAVATTISVAGTAVQITIFDTNGHSNSTTPDHTNDHITIAVAGHYFISISATVNSIAGAASKCELTCKKNNGASDIIPHQDRNLTGGGGESGVFSLSGIADLVLNDTVEVWIENETNTQNYVVEDICLTLFMIGGR